MKKELTLHIFCLAEKVRSTLKGSTVVLFAPQWLECHNKATAWVSIDFNTYNIWMLLMRLLLQARSLCRGVGQRFPHRDRWLRRFEPSWEAGHRHRNLDATTRAQSRQGPTRVRFGRTTRRDGSDGSRRRFRRNQVILIRDLFLQEVFCRKFACNAKKINACLSPWICAGRRIQIRIS